MLRPVQTDAAASDDPATAPVAFIDGEETHC
jgi:hypothetical protein